MMIKNAADIAIVGSGIVGLAHAYMALRKGYKVVLFERDQFPVSASIRNFGLIWPIGQEPGINLDRANRSREHWTDVAAESGFWINRNGSLHLAYHSDEMAVLEEFAGLYHDAGYDFQMLGATEVPEHSAIVRKQGLKGGLLSRSELTVNPREAVGRVSQWLQEKWGLITRYSSVVTEVTLPIVKTAAESWLVSKVFICNGADFETLYPEAFRSNVTKCKLQMMKAVTSEPVSIGPTLCAGLTLRHYKAFSACPSLRVMSQRYDEENKRFKEHGIHVLISQNNYGELIIGDTHHYGRTFEPFDSEELYTLILAYLSRFIDTGPIQVVERWNGIYSKVEDDTCLIVEPEADVTIVTGLGGAGMTLSFGIAEETINRL